MITSGLAIKAQVAEAEVSEDYRPMTTMPDPITAMMITEYAKREARKAKIEILKGIVSQRNHRRSIAILNNKDIREISSKIEENKIRILQIHNINSVLEQSRSHYIDEEMKKFDDENPCKEAEELIELEKLEVRDRESDAQKLIPQSNWGQTTGWSTTITADNSKVKCDGRGIR